jgi:LPXTG-motif cell wall-anchored protein
MDYGKVLGVTTGGLGAGAIAVLPNTGGSRSVLVNVAILSVAVGAGVLFSTIAAVAIKRHYKA